MGYYGCFGQEPQKPKRTHRTCDYDKAAGATLAFPNPLEPPQQLLE